VLEARGSAAQPDGIGVYTRELERALRAQGIVVRRIGAPPRVGTRLVRSREASLSFPLPLTYLAAAASVLHAPMPLAGAVEREIDVYHATDHMVPRLARTPVVATMHDAIPLAHPEWANPRLRRLKNWMLRDWVQSADAVIAISHAAIPELIEHYRIPGSRIRVVPLGVSASWFERPDDAATARTLAKHALSRGYFLNVGTLQPRKNIGALIDAYERLPQSIRSHRQLVLVGKYGWGAEVLRTRLDSLRSGGRVVWLDYVTHDELLALYAGAGMFVFPSLAEGFGLPMLEAFAMGLRVIASDLPSLVEVGQQHAHFVSARDADAISDAMARLDCASDDENAVKQRRAHAMQFDWGTCAARTADVYRALRR